MIAPKFVAFSEVYTTVKFLKVNVDDVEVGWGGGMVGAWGVSDPTGQAKWSMVGAHGGGACPDTIRVDIGLVERRQAYGDGALYCLGGVIISGRHATMWVTGITPTITSLTEPDPCGLLLKSTGDVCHV